MAKDTKRQPDLQAEPDATKLPARSIDAQLLACLPDDLKARLIDFLERECTGNVRINIVKGDVLGYHVDETIRCSPKL